MTTRVRRALSLMFAILGCSGELALWAAPTTEEQLAFFAERRKEKADFNADMAAETDSRTAALVDFNAKAQAERSAFLRSLQDVSPEERQQRLVDFNTAAREKKKAFQAALPSVSRNKLEKDLNDFDKKAVTDFNDFASGLDTADPVARAEALRQFRNAQAGERAKIKNQHFNGLNARKRNFQKEQTQKVRDFFGTA